MTWIQTFDGAKFDLLHPSPHSIEPMTLARVLSRTCRFGGHCREFYCVAQHSLMVCDLVQPWHLKLPALLHDAHEAYWGFGDIPRPAKNLDPLLKCFFTRHSHRIDAAIADRFSFDPILFEAPEIKQADNVALATEARDLMTEPPAAWETLPEPLQETIAPWTMDSAYALYCRRLAELWRGEKNLSRS